MPTFDELDKDAKEKAIERWKDQGDCWNDFDQESFVDNASRWLTEHGYLVGAKEIRWSLNPTDVNFEGEIDILDWAKHPDHKSWLQTGLKPAKYETRLVREILEPSWDEWRPLPKTITLEKFLELSDVRIFTPTIKMVGRFAYDIVMKISVEVEYVGEDEVLGEYYESFVPALEEVLWDGATDAASTLGAMLNDEIEYVCSDEYITETLQANEYEFDEEGILQ